MPKDLAHCHPADWLKEIQSPKFFREFENDDELLDISISDTAYTALFEIAKDNGGQQSIGAALKAILFKKLYGQYAYRKMQIFKIGFFSPHEFKTHNTESKLQGLNLKVQVPKKLLFDLNDFNNFQLTKHNNLSNLINNIIIHFAFGYKQPKRQSPESGGNIYKRKAENTLKITIHYSPELDEFLEHELQGSKIGKSRFIMDALAESVFGYLNCLSINSIAEGNCFMQSDISLVSRTKSPYKFEEYWSKKNEQLTLQLPKQFIDDLAVAVGDLNRNKQPDLFLDEKYHGIGPLCRNVLHRYFFGGLFVAKNLDIQNHLQDGVDE